MNRREARSFRKLQRKIRKVTHDQNYATWRDQTIDHMQALQATGDQKAISAYKSQVRAVYAWMDEAKALNAKAEQRTAKLRAGREVENMFSGAGIKTPRELRRRRLVHRIVALMLVLPTIFALILIAPIAIQFVRQTISQASPLLQLVGMHPHGSSTYGQIAGSYQSKAANLTQIIQGMP